MSTVDLYIKIITLLVREIELGENNPNDNSTDLIKTILNLNKGKKLSNLSGGESDLLSDLKQLIITITNDPDSYTVEMVMESLSIILKDKQELLAIAKKAIEMDMTVSGLKKSIVALRKYLNNYYRDAVATETIMDAAYKLKTDRLDGETKQAFISRLITNLESLTLTTRSKDQGVVDELDIEDEDSMTNVLNVVKDQAEGVIKLKTGWKKLNEMLNGGFRKGECVVINALQHKYKSGFTQSLFMQLAMHNTPVVTSKDKKPLIVYISFEDNADVFTEFMYRYLYYNEFREIPDLTKVTPHDISAYIKAKLTRTGYNVKLLRVDPSEWTYKHIINKTLEYEADGYEVHAVIVDYLAKLPSTGCISGPSGVDYRDMWNRLRNYFSARSTLFISPWQLSTEAKQLIRNGVSDVNFVKEIAGKGYTELSKQIDQVVDLELYIHIANVNRKPFLTVQRGKHRSPTIIDPDKMYFMLPFPHKAPILEDINEEGDTSVGDIDTKQENDLNFDF